MQTWREAWELSSYGPSGFYTTGAGAATGPRGHFRTSSLTGSAHVSVYAEALAQLAIRTDERLGSPKVFDIVDVGAGRGELLVALLGELPADLKARVRAYAVDVRPAPPNWPADVTWIEGAAPEAIPRAVTGLVMANEWLDDIALDVVELDGAGQLREVLADGLSLGESVDDVTAKWVQAWWPLNEVGHRAEVGLPRDEAWIGLCDSLLIGTALVMDYGLTTLQTNNLSLGTVVGYRAGRALAPVPDGTMNITAHIQVDSASRAVPGTVVERQHDALEALGVSGAMPSDPLDAACYADALDRVSQSVELRNLSGLGAQWWLRLDR